MTFPLHILFTYGYLLLFGWVLIEQLGLPLPATPALLAAGALSARGQLRIAEAFGAALLAVLVADTAWFSFGRRFGHHVLNFLCKLSLEPTTCVRRTQESFGRRRGALLLVAKFIPGLATLAAPVAAQNGMSFGAFFALDGLGGALWCATFLAGGGIFADALEHDPRALAWVERFSGALLVALIATILVGRVLRRRAILRKLNAARVEPLELKRQLDAGEPVYIVDLRHPLELVPEPFTLPGALHFAPDTLARRHHEIPRDRDVVLFCTCPSEATAAKTAMTLHRLGIERVRPLRGGYDEWKRLGFPLDDVAPVSTPRLRA
ncbi:MAG: VTT domain-containing protein [Acidobacteriota bacterium]